MLGLQKLKFAMFSIFLRREDKLFIVYGSYAMYIFTSNPHHKNAGGVLSQNASCVILQDEKAIQNLKTFLKSFKKYSVYFILEETEHNFKYEVIKTFDTTSPNHLINKLLQEQTQNKLCDYLVYQDDGIDHSWFVLLLCMNLDEKMLAILNVIFESKVLLGGFYSIGFELYRNLAKGLFYQSDNPSELQVLVIPLQAFGIKVIATNNRDLFFTKSVGLSFTESNEYLNGLIEQSVYDVVSHFKAHIVQGDMQVTLLLAFDIDITNNLHFSYVKVDKMIVVDKRKFIVQGEKIQKTLCDELVIDLANRQKKVLREKSFDKLHLLYKLNSIFFKPFLSVLLVFMFYIAHLESKNWNKKKELSKITIDYYLLLDKTSEISKVYPQMNVYDLYNLYKMQHFIQNLAQGEVVGDLRKALGCLLEQNFYIISMEWQVNGGIVNRNDSNARVVLGYNGTSWSKFEKSTRDITDALQKNFSRSLLVTKNNAESVILPDNISAILEIYFSIPYAYKNFSNF